MKINELKFTYSSNAGFWIKIENNEFNWDPRGDSVGGYSECLLDKVKLLVSGRIKSRTSISKHESKQLKKVI